MYAETPLGKETSSDAEEIKAYSALSLVLSLSAIVFCIYNYNGAVSEQFRGVKNVAFCGTLGTPVGTAEVALVLGVAAYIAVNVLIKLSVGGDK